MSNKEAFVKEIKALIEDNPNSLTNGAKEFFFKTYCPDPSTIKLTDAAKDIMRVMQNDIETALSSKDIGEALGKSGRAVSGSMRKLVEIGYVEKASESPITYKLTSNGINFAIE